jgi:hypothetical protein
MMPGFSPSSVVRALGPATALLVPRWVPARLAALAAGDVAARRVGTPGFTIVSIVPARGTTFPLPKRIGAEAAGVLGWVAAGSALVAGADRLPVPRPVRALLAGTLVFVADVQARAAADRARAAAGAR